MSEAKLFALPIGSALWQFAKPSDAWHAAAMNFVLIGAIQEIETIGYGHGVRELRRLNRQYGRARWRKLKGCGNVRLDDGSIRLAEIHWYEAHGRGRKELKIKRYLD